MDYRYCNIFIHDLLNEISVCGCQTSYIRGHIDHRVSANSICVPSRRDASHFIMQELFYFLAQKLVSSCVYKQIESAMNFFVPKHHHRNVFFICTWYTFASTSVFGAFSLILPDAAVAGRSASRTIISVILTVVTLHEAVTLLQLCALWYVYFLT